MRIIETARKRILNGNVENPFVLDLNGVTIRLKTDQGFGAGSVGLADFDPSGKVYTAVDETMWNALDPTTDDYTVICTTLVTDMSSAFSNVSFNQGISHFDTSNVTNMFNMFGQNYSFNKDISKWDVSNVINMAFMFRGLGSRTVFNQPLDNWDVSSVENMQAIFEFSQYDKHLNSWNVTNVTDMNRMFKDSSFNQPIGNWDVSNVTQMNSMFEDSVFNQDIGLWDTSLVIDMNEMFRDNNVFNQDLTSWCVQLIPSEPTNFAQPTFLPANRPNFGTPC